MNYVEAQFNRSFFRRPRGGYPQPNPGAINNVAPAVVVRIKGSKSYRPIQRSAQAKA
jgi:hypothetical protein